MNKMSSIGNKQGNALRFHAPTRQRANTPTVLRRKTIGFIGIGTMGQAIVKGLLKHGVSARRIVACDASEETRREVARHFGIRITYDNRKLLEESDIVILAIKPQHLSEVTSQLASSFSRKQLVISIAAGITLKWLQARLRDVPVIRVMPNLPAIVGQGFSAIALGRKATKRDQIVAEALFRSVGEVIRLPERHFDAITAISGSGPAYVFFLVQAWEDAARSLGLPQEIATQAIRATLRGGTELIHGSSDSISSLIAQVASKGGTTEAALKVLGRRRVALHLMEAMRAAARRSKELSWS